MKKIIVALLTGCALLAGGCGYHFGSLSHPQLQSIAVAPVANDTLSFNASALLRNMLNERIVTDGSMKLESLRRADCIIYSRITDVNYLALGYGRAPDGNDTFLANEWRCTVSVEYSVIIPGRGKPLIANRTVKGTSDFTTGPDLEVSRDSAMRQACFDAAKKIVSATVEGW